MIVEIGQAGIVYRHTLIASALSMIDSDPAKAAEAIAEEVQNRHALAVEWTATDTGRSCGAYIVFMGDDVDFVRVPLPSDA